MPIMYIILCIDVACNRSIENRATQYNGEYKVNCIMNICKDQMAIRNRRGPMNPIYLRTISILDAIRELIPFNIV